MAPAEHSVLRERLARLYPSEKDARRVLADAKVDSTRIDFSGSAKSIWESALLEAERAGLTDAIKRILEGEYPGSPHAQFVPFCEREQTFSRYTTSHIRIDSVQHDRSDLWYVFFFVKTPAFKECRGAIIDLARAEHRMSDIVVWNLLGSAELLMIFRASEDVAERFVAKVHGAVKRHLRGHGVEAVNVQREYVPRAEEHGGHTPGVRRLVTPFPYGEARSTRAFIKLKLRPQRRRRAATGHGAPGAFIEETHVSFFGALSGFHEIIEGWSMGRLCDPHRGARTKQYCIIDLHMSCGRFQQMVEFSKELEMRLGDFAEKDSFIVYHEEHLRSVR